MDKTTLLINQNRGEKAFGSGFCINECASGKMRWIFEPDRVSDSFVAWKGERVSLLVWSILRIRNIFNIQMWATINKYELRNIKNLSLFLNIKNSNRFGFELHNPSFSFCLHNLLKNIYFLAGWWTLSGCFCQS